MSETYLNGKITVTSLAAPNDEDIAKIRALSPEEHRAMIRESLLVGENSGISDRTVDEIYESAVRKARKSA